MLFPLLLFLLPPASLLPVTMHSYDTAEAHAQSLLQYPVVVTSQRVGIHRFVHIPARLAPFPKLTFTTWLYLKKYCREPGNERCAVLCRVNEKGEARTPTIYLNSEGHLVFSSQLISGPADLVISGFTLPLKQWVAVQLNIYKLQIQIIARDKHAREIGSMVHTFDHMLKLNYADAEWNIGGNLWHLSVDGAVGMTDLYVNQHVSPDAVRWPTHVHAMFKIGNGTTPTCQMMRYNLYQLLHKDTYTPSKEHQLMFQSDTERDQFEDTAIRVGEQLLNQAYPLLEHGSVVEGYKLLAQAECYNSVNASYTKAVIEAPDLPPDGKEFLAGALQGDVLSDLALAFRHRFDTASEIPEDCESALVYYERLALQAHETMNNATLHNVWAETVKLSSERELLDQEGEGSAQHKKNVELAVEGDVEAAKRLGAQHMWGAQGRTKDLDKAYEYYKRAADSGDLQALHETGLMKISGHGTRQDKKGGMEMLIRAAEAGFVASLGGLGWYHSEHSGNLTEAVKYYKQGAAAGDKNSMYSLGMVYVRPDLPGGARHNEALVQFESAAAQGHLAAALEAGSLHKFGMGTARNCNHALRYYSWIGIKHDQLARLTRRALEHYFKGEFQEAFICYQLASEAGCETSQYNAAYLTEKQNSKTFHPSRSATLYYYSLSALQDNAQAELALTLYNLNLASINTQLQEKSKIRTVTAATVQFRGHVHEIVFQQTDYNISVEYSSAERMVVGVELVSLDPVNTATTLKVWTQKLLLSDKNTYKKRARVRLFLPKQLQALPDKEDNVLGQVVQLRSWIANIDTWAEDAHAVYAYAKDRAWIEIIGPWTPQSKFQELTMCMSWAAWVLSWQRARFPQCPLKQEWANKGFPFIMNGKQCGLAIKDEDYLPQEENTVTLSLWFLLTNKCNEEQCSLLYRFDSSGTLYSPLVTIDRKLRLHITVYFGQDGRIATLDDAIPLGKWVHLAVSLGGGLLVSCVEEGHARTHQRCQYWRFNQPILYDENDGMWLMGGNFYMPGMTGYFGRLQVHRDQFYGADKLMGALGAPLPGDLMWDTNSRRGYVMCKKTFQ